MGTSSLTFSDGRDRLLIDGYFSRPHLGSLLATPLRPDTQAIEDSLAGAKIDQLSAVLVAHTHFDHALDAIPIATRFSARLMGSQALLDLAQTHPDKPQVKVLADRQREQVGAFSITSYVTPHAPGDVASGAKPGPMRHPARARDWHLGEAYSFLIQHGQCRILVVPSAGEIGPRLSNAKADVIFLGIGQLARRGQKGIDQYWHDTVRASQAQVVIPIHWDDFTRPLDQPLKPLPHVADRFDQTMERLSMLAARDGVALRLPPLFDPMDLGTYTNGACR